VAGADVFVTGDQCVLAWSVVGVTRVVSPCQAVMIDFSGT
jgi:hypothetical protein